MELRKESAIKIRNRGVDALAKALGPVGMARFIQQFDTGSGDYTQDRKQWLEEITVRNAVGEIKGQREKASE